MQKSRHPCTQQTHDRCGEIWNSPHMACVWYRKRRHTCQIYAIFFRNFHNLRAFKRRKIEPKSTFVQKKWQISGLCCKLFALQRRCFFHWPEFCHCVITIVGSLNPITLRLQQKCLVSWFCLFTSRNKPKAFFVFELTGQSNKLINLYK